MKVFGDGRTTHLGAAFENKRFESGLGEIEGGDEAVVPATDDDYIARRVRFAEGIRLPFRLLEFRARPDVRARP